MRIITGLSNIFSLPNHKLHIPLSSNTRTHQMEHSLKRVIKTEFLNRDWIMENKLFSCTTAKRQSSRNQTHYFLTNIFGDISKKQLKRNHFKIK
jgi:hypothetical protein